MARSAQPAAVSRMVYAERWAAMSEAEKAEVVNGHTAEIDDLAERLESMSEAEKARFVEQQLVLLDASVGRIESLRDHLSRLVADRDLIFVRLALAGVSQGSIARRAKVRSTMVVAFGIGAARRGKK